MRQLALLMFVTSFVGCGDDPAPTVAMRAYPSPPSSTELCGLVPHESTSADVRRVLGQPDIADTLADRSATSFYYYAVPPGRSIPIALIQFWFTSDERFASATVSNIEMPSCWAIDGGV